jgi:hypothetical protein
MSEMKRLGVVLVTVVLLGGDSVPSLHSQYNSTHRRFTQNILVCFVFSRRDPALIPGEPGVGSVRRGHV